MKSQGVGRQELADKTGYEIGYINQVLSGGNAVSKSLVYELSKNYKGVNGEWILKGTGTMIPLSKLAKELIQEGGGKGEFLFEVPADATTNLRLKEIATAAGIDKRLTTHVGRHTFGFLYLLMGGKVEELREIMGHSKMETTQIYTHTDHDRKVAGVLRFDEIFRAAK